jgi:hypothetical protein
MRSNTLVLGRATVSSASRNLIIAPIGCTPRVLPRQVLNALRTGSTIRSNKERVVVIPVMTLLRFIHLKAGTVAT